MNIAFASNDNYCMHLATVIASVLKNTRNKENLNIFIFETDITEENKSKILNIQKIEKCSILFKNISDYEYKGQKGSGAPHVSSEAFLRLNLPKWLPTIGKCIYLDCDLIVLEDLLKLWEFPIEDNMIGAVEGIRKIDDGRLKRLNIPEKFSYFNSGVLLLDLNKLREFDFSPKAHDYLLKNGEQTFGDQDILNALLYDKWKPLPFRWNLTTQAMIEQKHIKYKRYTTKEIDASIKNPAIVHYTEKHKPDSFLCTHPYSKSYRKYRKFTKWRNEPIKDLTLRTFLRKYYYKWRNFFK